MAFLSYAQLRAYAAAAGAADPDTAAAVALAETDGTGNTNAHNPIPPDDSYGVWQINMIGAEGPQRRKQLGITSNTQLYDPAVNARAMAMISSGGTNFKPWATFTSGKYNTYLKGGGTTGAVDASATDANALTSIPGDIVGSVKDTSSIVISAANWVANPSNWLRVVYVIAGAAVTLVGLDLLVENKILGKTAQALGGDAGGGTMKSAGTIAKSVFSPGGKAKAIGGAAKGTAKKAAVKPAAAAKGVTP